MLLLGAGENEALPILKSLHGQGVPVTVACPSRLSLGFFSRFPRARLLCPDPERAPEKFVEWTEDQVRNGDFGVTMTCGDTVTWLMSKEKARFAGLTRLPIPDIDRFMVCRDKSRTMQAAAVSGIPIPATYFPDAKGVESIVSEITTYPVVVKPCISNGARGISYPSGPDELRRAITSVRSTFGSCIVQEYIPHHGMQYKAEVLLDDDGTLIAGGVYSKPRYYPPEGGSSTLNCTVDRADILDLAVRFLRSIGWSGMGDCDFIVDPRDDTPRLMEVNPRFTRSIKILIWAGLDFPYLLYSLALGLPVNPQLEYAKGLYMRYFLSDCVWFLRSPERFSARPSFFWFFGKNLREEIFSWSDPGPWFAYCLAQLTRMFSSRDREFLLRV